MVANSGRFANSLPMILAAAPFDRFMALSDWLFEKTDATHRIALERLAVLVAQWLSMNGMTEDAAKALLSSDYAGQVNLPRQHARPPAVAPVAGVPERQARHLAA
jgi:hypothetical protein